MNDAKERFFEAWARLPERDSRYEDLMQQLGSFLGDRSWMEWPLPNGQRLSVHWRRPNPDIVGREDGWTIVFERQWRNERENMVPNSPEFVVTLSPVAFAPPWPAPTTGAILRHGARQVRLEYVRDKWVVEGRGELTETVFYETLLQLLRLEA